MVKKEFKVGDIVKLYNLENNLYIIDSVGKNGMWIKFEIVAQKDKASIYVIPYGGYPINNYYNKIDDIMILSSLVNLKSVQLSNNSIKDISPLFELEKLEYADLSGNKVELDKINELIELGVTVDF